MAGDIGARFKAELTPVVIAGDLREPGLNDNKGRAWMLPYYQNTIALNTHFVLQATQPVIIDWFSLQVTPTATSLWSVYVYGPNDNPGHVANTTRGSMVENLQALAEIPPILTSPAFGVFNAGNVIMRGLHQIQYAAVWPLRVMLPVGGKISVHTSQAITDGAFNFGGRVFMGR